MFKNVSQIDISDFKGPVNVLLGRKIAAELAEGERIRFKFEMTTCEKGRQIARQEKCI